MSTSGSDVSPKGSGRRSRSKLDTSLQGWSASRVWLEKLLHHMWFDAGMALVIIANVGVMAHEAESKISCGSTKCETAIANYVDWCFLAIYTIEVLLRFYVYRLDFFRSGWNVLDLAIVLSGYIELVIHVASKNSSSGTPNMALLRLLRALRVLRTFRLLEEIPELYIMLRSFVSALRAMFWGILMIVILLFMFSILTLQFIHPIAAGLHEQDEFCTEWFSKIWLCMVLFFQGMVAGDSWGRCAMPVIQDAWWSIFIFGGALMCVTLGFMNLILATVVEHAADSRAANEEERMNNLREARLNTTDKLRNTLHDMDADNSGTISLEEFMDGYENNEEMQKLFFKLDMKREDVSAVFDLMDIEGNNNLSYDSLIDNLRLAEDGDNHKSLLMLRLQSAESVIMNKRIDHHMNELMSLWRSYFEGSGGNCIGHSSDDTMPKVQNSSGLLKTPGVTPRDKLDTLHQAAKPISVAGIDARQHLKDPTSVDLGIECRIGSIQRIGTPASGPRTPGMSPRDDALDQNAKCSSVAGNLVGADARKPLKHPVSNEIQPCGKGSTALVEHH